MYQLRMAGLREYTISSLRKELGRVSNVNQSITWHQHMKDHVEMEYLSKFDAFMYNRDQAMDL